MEFTSAAGLQCPSTGCHSTNLFTSVSVHFSNLNPKQSGGGGAYFSVRLLFKVPGAQFNQVFSLTKNLKLQITLLPPGWLRSCQHYCPEWHAVRQETLANTSRFPHNTEPSLTKLQDIVSSWESFASFLFHSCE